MHSSAYARAPIMHGGHGFANDFEHFVATRKAYDRMIHKASHYFHIYETHFAPLRASGKPLRMLELGVQSGGSLEMWKSYFGESLELHGVDINPACMRLNDPKRKITIHLGATSDSEFMEDLARKLAPLDIVVDDASHHSADIMAALVHLFPVIRLQPPSGQLGPRPAWGPHGGLYVVEDLHTNYWINGEFKEGPGNPATFIEQAKRYVDQMHADHAYNWTDPASGRSLKSPSMGMRLMAPTDALSKTIVGMHFYPSVVVLQKGVFRSRDFEAGGLKLRHEMSLEHQRPSATQVARARWTAAQVSYFARYHRNTTSKPHVRPRATPKPNTPPQRPRAT